MAPLRLKMNLTKNLPITFVRYGPSLSTRLALRRRHLKTGPAKPGEPIPEEDIVTKSFLDWGEAHQAENPTPESFPVPGTKIGQRNSGGFDDPKSVEPK